MARSEGEKRTRLPGKGHISGPSSEKQNKTAPVNNTPATHTPGKMTPAFRMDERSFDMVVDGVPYSVRSVPFFFNDEPRFRVCINGGTEHLFTWDSQTGILRAIDDESSSIPSVVEEALSERLQSK